MPVREGLDYRASGLIQAKVDRESLKSGSLELKEVDLARLAQR
jgi:hypothetical protein